MGSGGNRLGGKQEKREEMSEKWKVGGGEGG